MSKWNIFFRKFIDRSNRKKLKNKDFSLISSNCNGALILHDLNLKYMSPTVNLWIKPGDFIEFLRNMEKYLLSDLEFSDEEERELGYPVGILGGEIHIYFQHYTSRENARQKWMERGARVNLDNLFILFSDRDGCTYQQLEEFDKLPYKNKIVFTNKKYPEIKSAFYIKGFESMESVGYCYKYRNQFTGKKYYDAFPYVKWFNGEL